ncbi:MAG TPA: septation protein SepH [Pseudonocardiaceae bacterium]|jgi:hypothetical protein|nr:septation protein SepH [Pseudonocardiaceae bacterium]
MRALRVVGLGADDRTIIVEIVAQQSGARREQFALPLDDNLHAAVRGDLPHVDQSEIEPDSPMRPREIQARIRAGASVEQVATAAGVPCERIERFAYPVLLERSRIAQLAQHAHPVRTDGPDLRTLEAVVTETFRCRGHDLGTVSWDAWRGDDAKWVVQLRWRAGRSENRAHWTLHPGAHGGTVTALDDHATALIDPQPAVPSSAEPAIRSLRTVRPATEEPAVPDDGPAYCASEQPGQPPAKRGRKDRAIVPSWEDVLLGVRSPRG